MFFAGLILFAFCVLVFSYGLGQVSFNFMEFLVRNLSAFVFFVSFLEFLCVLPDFSAFIGAMRG